MNCRSNSALLPLAGPIGLLYAHAVKLGRLTGVATILIALAAANGASAATITEFEADPGKASFPLNITSGPDGNLWFTDLGQQPGIHRMSPSAEYFPVIPDNDEPIDLVVAPSGWASWTTEKGVASRSPAGGVEISHEYKHGGAIVLQPNNQIRVGFGLQSSPPQAMICKTALDHVVAFDLSCAGPATGFGAVTGMGASAANLFVAFYEWNQVGIYNSAGNFLSLVGLPDDSGPAGIAIGPEGDAWVAMFEANSIDRITPTGARTRFLLPSGRKPDDLVLGPDGAFWIAEFGAGKIGRMTTDGVLTNEYSVPSGEPGQTGITVGPDSNIWFTDPEAAKIGRLVPDPPAPGAGPRSAKDTVAPSFTGAPAFSPARFKVANVNAAASAHGAPSGSTLKLSLSEAATVTATIARKAPGRKLGKKCTAPGKAKATAKKCTRYLTKGTMTLNGAAGANQYPFSGKLGRKSLVPGSYLATLIARDGAGNDSAPKATGFTIVR